MTNSRAGLDARYLIALRRHLGRAVDAPGYESARMLGRAARSAGLVTLDLARLHERAMVALAPTFVSAGRRGDALRRAGSFFTHALVPLEAARKAAAETNRRLQERNATLRRHTAALARSNRRLEREVARRLAGEAALRQGRERYQKLFLESEVMQKKLRQLTRQILSAQEEERKEISRELHDEVVQTLVGINVELSALGKGASNGLVSLQSKIARTRRLVEKSVKAVHRFARELRPAALDDLGLIPALHAYVKTVAARTKLKIHLTVFAGVEQLDHARRVVLYRVAQEALTNVARHAEASRVDLSIVRRPAAVRLEVSDDGKSFPVPATLSARTNRRLGLVGMRERVEMVGGTLVVESAPGRGTTVRADVPFPTGGTA